MVCYLVKQGRLIILLVEDDPNDVLFVQRAVEKSRAGHTVHAVSDGEEAIHYLRGEGAFADRNKFPLPNVVLLDLKMPRMDGFEFLVWLGNNPECSIIPIIVYTSSSIERDVKEAYRLGANAYIRKPGDLKEFIETLGALCAFWSRCECPPMPSGC